VNDHYTVLGVGREASPQEIESAYRRAALERGYQDGVWRELRDAYDVLRDPDQRARYDETGDGALPKEPKKPTHNPLDRLFPNLPHGWRVAIDWVVTIAGAVAIVLAIKAWIVNPYRIPSSSMEPTLHCARPASACEASASDRVLACRFCYHIHSPKRGDIVVFKTPKLARQECGSEGTFVKRLIGLPGEAWAERNGLVYINGKKLNEPYIRPARRDTQTLTLSDIPPR
jgi:signal peptidase I